jgi:mono/diheme cytochrome c family protein
VRIRQAIFGLAVLLLIIVSIPHLGSSQEVKQMGAPAKGSSHERVVARGKYLVEGVAVCGQCHTPRNAAGNLDRSKWLEGASLWLRPTQPTADWPLTAPRIAGSPPGSEAELVTLLTTGIWRDGKPLRQPMPQFRMTREDAESVIAYLRSLNPTLP